MKRLFTINNEYNILARKADFTTAFDETIFLLRMVKSVDHMISPEGMKPIASRVEDLRNVQSLECKRDVIKVLECLGLSGCYIKILQVGSQPFYDLVKTTTSFHGTVEHQNRFQSTKDRNTQETTLAVPSTDYPIHFNAGSSYIGFS